MKHHSLSSTWLNSRLPQISTLIGQNNNLVTLQPWEQYEKAVNGILLLSIGSGNYTLTAPQVTILQDIANGCPLSDGEAVYQARALLALTEGEENDYDDDMLCAAASNRSSTNAANPAGATLVNAYPNPASDEITFEYRLGLMATKQMDIYNQHGQLVQTVVLDGTTGRIKVPLHGFSEGIYWYQIPHTAEKAQTGKFVINR